MRLELVHGDITEQPAGDLPARWVIHTVGPVFGRGTVEQPLVLFSAEAHRRAARRLGSGQDQA